MIGLLEKTMTNTLLDKKQAAEHLGIPVAVLAGQCKLGTGPAFIRPSPHRMMFHEKDLDAWRATWKVVQAKALSDATSQIA
jgi:hypothetical protein